MKLHLNRLVFACCFFSASFQLPAQGYIVPNGVTIFPGNSTGAGSEIHVIQNPTNGDYTGFNFTPQGASTFLFNPFLDEGVRTFLVSFNDPISFQSIEAQDYTELTYPNGYSFAVGSPFYLAFYTGFDPFDSHGNYTGIYTNPVFGWGEFVNDQGVIQMLDSGLEIQGSGIYTGTLNIIPVPEPTTLALLATGAVVLALRWRRSSNQ